MLRNALLEIRRHPGRLGAVALAIMISVGFLSAVQTFVATETRAIGAAVTAQTSTSDVIVEVDESSKSYAGVLAGVPGVRLVDPVYSGYTEFSTGAGGGPLIVESLAAPEFRWASLDSGAWPSAASEVAISSSTASQYDLALGTRIAFSSPDGTGSIPMTVVGITDQSQSLLSGVNPSTFVAPAYFTADGKSYPQYLIKGDGSVSPDQLADRVRAVLPADAQVDTSEARGAAAVDSITNGADVFTYLLQIFAAIALLVGAIIIANTFSILITQRRRQIGLLRAVGASTQQVRRGVLAEALIVGLAGSVAGVGLGIGIAAIASAVTGSLSSGLALPWLGLGVAALVGLVVTVLAAVVPASRAMKVAPLEALRPVADAVGRRRSYRLVLVVSLVLLLAGGALVGVGLGTGTAPLLLSVAGSCLLALAIMVAAPLFLPALLGVVGRLAGLGGATGRLAAANTIRNPGRAAATSVALMLAVGLIVTLQVGAASVKGTVNDSLSSEFPVDVTVLNPMEPLPRGLRAAVASVDGISAVTDVTQAAGSVSTPSGPASVVLDGLAADADQVVASGLPALSSDRVALLHRYTLESLGLTSGDDFTVTAGSRKATFTAVESDVAGSSAGLIVVRASALAQLAPDAPVAELWARAADRSQAADVMADVRQVVGAAAGADGSGTGGSEAGSGSLTVGGSLEQSAQLNTLMDTLLNVATALLGVAVIIALIGVSNTLGLSVIERTRESALLRALGLQRSQLRLMLVIEAVLLALVGAVIGIAAGVLFGWIGTMALVTQASLPVLRFSISVPQTMAVVLVAVLAGALASILPGRRAAQAAPTEALAEV